MLPPVPNRTLRDEIRSERSIAVQLPARNEHLLARVKLDRVHAVWVQIPEGGRDNYLLYSLGIWNPIEGPIQTVWILTHSRIPKVESSRP